MARLPRLARQIASGRKQAGLYQVELADRLGVSERTVTKWERGQTIPREMHLRMLAAELQLDFRELRRLTMAERERRARKREVAA